MGAVLLFFLGVDRILNVVPFSVASCVCCHFLPAVPSHLAVCAHRRLDCRSPDRFCKTFPRWSSLAAWRCSYRPTRGSRSTLLPRYERSSAKCCQEPKSAKKRVRREAYGCSLYAIFVWFDARLFRICSSFSDSGYVCFVHRLASALLFGFKPFFLLVDSSFIGTGKCYLRHRRTQTTSSHRPSQRLNLVVDWGLISGVARRLPGGRRRGRPRRGIC